MKKAIALFMILVALLPMSGCNKTFIYKTLKYDYAIIEFPDGTTKKVEIKEWCDYGGSNQIQVTATDGTVYLVHSTDCVLVRESNQ